MDRDPFFTILTASLNNGATIRNTLESMKNQTCQDFEHIVIDGGSTDDSLSILKNYDSTYNLLWKSEPDGGISDALNKGLQLATGHFVFVLQADDSLINTYSLDKAHRLIVSHKADIFSFPVLLKTAELGEQIIRPIRILWYHHFKFIFHHQGLFVDRNLFFKVGEFRKNFGISMDYDFTYRALKNKAVVRFERIPIARMQAGGVSSFVYERVKEDRRVQLLNEKNLLWRTAQMMFYALYLPYKKIQLNSRDRSMRCALSKNREGYHSKMPSQPCQLPHILILTKRQYMKKDLIDDGFGRFREIPLELARMGHRVSGLCLSYAPKKSGYMMDEKVIWKSINATFLKIPGLFHFIRQASQHARNVDVIWACSDSFYGIIGYFLSRRHGVPLVFDIYDNFEYYLAARLPILKQLYRMVVRRCEAVTCVSKPLARLIRSYGRNGPVYVIENAVRTDLFKPLDKEACRKKLDLPRNVPIIGTAGAIFKNRGASTLLTAFERLKPNYPALCLALAGPRDIEIPRVPGIIDLGILPLEQVPLLLNALDVAVICNRANDFGRYCFPQKTREIIGCRVPLVAARVGSMEEFFDDHPEWLYDSDNALSLVEALERRLTDRHTGYGNVPDWSDLAHELERIFLSLKMMS